MKIIEDDPWLAIRSVKNEYMRELSNQDYTKEWFQRERRIHPDLVALKVVENRRRYAVLYSKLRRAGFI